MDNRKITPVQSRRGSALLLVLVVTVLLSVIGILFVMVTRLRDISSSNVADSHDLDSGVEAVVGNINKTLKNDVLSAISGAEIYDSNVSDLWLASLEPTWLNDNGTPANPADDWYQWGQITDLTGVASQWDLILRDGQKTPWVLPQFGGIVEDYQSFTVTTAGKTLPMTPAQIEGLPADADGDGVADSMWIQLLNISSSRGQPILAAVRIIDNCAMLNLNTAFGFYQQPSTIPWYSKPWLITTAPTWMPYPNGFNFGQNMGRYLSEVNFSVFLRAHDINRPERIQFARDTNAKIRNLKQLSDPDYYPYNSQADDYHNKAVMGIDFQNSAFSFFNISDELEIRNRFLVTSKCISRFERRDPQEQANVNAVPSIQIPLPANAYQGIAYQTFDLGRGESVPGLDTWAGCVPCRVPSTPFSLKDFGQWKKKLNPALFDSDPYNTPAQDSYEYDRRHVCTFYSFDRNLRTAKTTFYTFLETQPEVICDIFMPKYKMAITTNIQNLTATQPYNNVETRRKILHLLYAFREYLINEKGLAFDRAAIKSAQIVANMIDYADDDTQTTQGPFYNTPTTLTDLATGAVYTITFFKQKNSDPTVINRAIIRDLILEQCIESRNADFQKNIIPVRCPIIDSGIIPQTPLNSYDFGLGLTYSSEVVYGYERQPFITEVYTRIDDSGVVDRFAIELYNPYSTNIELTNWKLVLEDQSAPPGNLLQQYVFSDADIPAGQHLVVRSSSLIPSGGMSIENVGFGTQIKNAYKIRLIRTFLFDGTTDMVVDQIRRSQIQLITTDVVDGLYTHHSLKREDNSWKFCNSRKFQDPNNMHVSQNFPAGIDNPGTMLTLGSFNGGSSDMLYSLPVADNSMPIGRLADFGRVVFVGNEGIGPDPNTITDMISMASSEGDVRVDLNSNATILKYICTLNREKGNLPGRININTAPVHVIAAAIPPSLVMTALNDPNNALVIAQQMVDGRPYRSIADMSKLPLMQKYMNITGLNIGDTSIDNDFEERDWIFNRLSNIFTVRSDTFTAYILVRLGTDGPQRRMIAIFDRSNVWSKDNTPRLVALHPVPDPR